MLLTSKRVLSRLLVVAGIAGAMFVGSWLVLRPPAAAPAGVVDDAAPDDSPWPDWHALRVINDSAALKPGADTTAIAGALDEIEGLRKIEAELPAWRAELLREQLTQLIAALLDDTPAAYVEAVSSWGGRPKSAEHIEWLWETWNRDGAIRPLWTAFDLSGGQLLRARVDPQTAEPNPAVRLDLEHAAYIGQSSFIFSNDAQFKLPGSTDRFVLRFPARDLIGFDRSIRLLISWSPSAGRWWFPGWAIVGDRTEALFSLPF
jgi:hypothetical protein